MRENDPMTVTIFHNPACGTSRNTLAMVRNAGIEPDVIEYLKTPPSREALTDLVARMGIPLRGVLRRKGTPFDELGLGDPALTDADLLDAVERHPILINRPIVVTGRGVKLCRPSEIVLDLLDAPQRSDFLKEDGEPVVTASRLGAVDIEELAALLNAADLPTADLALPDRQFYRFSTTLGERVAVGGLEGRGADRLVRSIAVVPTARGKGFGKAVAMTLERLAGEDGAKRLHLLTTTAAPFFERLGYGAADRSTAPVEISASAEFAGLCPATAHYMTKDVRRTW
jgi:arsenate reductase (glutaredoxin)